MAGTQPPEGPPICTALMRRPSAAPPPISSTISRRVVPIGTSINPPRRIFPARANTLVPLLLAVPKAANFSAPCRMIQGTRASVSTLLISVGLPQRPDSAGNGGRSRGMPRRPSTEAIRAVSSPQTNAPGAFHDAQAQWVIRAQQARAQPAALFHFRNRRPHPLDRQRIFVADIENAFVRADRHRGQRQPLDDAERKRFENHAVHERAGVAFVAVADHIFDVARLLADDAPFLAAGKSRAAASAQAGFLDGGDEFFGRKRGLV